MKNPVLAFTAMLLILSFSPFKTKAQTPTPSKLTIIPNLQTELYYPGGDLGTIEITNFDPAKPIQIICYSDSAGFRPNIWVKGAKNEEMTKDITMARVIAMPYVGTTKLIINLSIEPSWWYEHENCPDRNMAISVPLHVFCDVNEIATTVIWHPSPVAFEVAEEKPTIKQGTWCNSILLPYQIITVGDFYTPQVNEEVLWTEQQKSLVDSLEKVVTNLYLLTTESDRYSKPPTTGYSILGLLSSQADVPNPFSLRVQIWKKRNLMGNYVTLADQLTYREVVQLQRQGLELERQLIQLLEKDNLYLKVWNCNAGQEVFQYILTKKQTEKWRKQNIKNQKLLAKENYLKQQ